ncbi:MAG: hypothetical protein IT559_02425 [Alphaproteobacteria bacterium]|nr:hypothetical protein [Alphaproteobacteria bacterium]
MVDFVPEKILDCADLRAKKLEALEQMAGGLAHDFNNVFSIIDGYIRLLAGRLEGQAEAMSYLERMGAASGRGAALIKKMLIFSRSKTENAPIIDLAAALREQESFLRPLFSPETRIVLRVSEDDLYVRCSADTIMRILLYLAENSRDAMAIGGVFSVEARRCPLYDLPVWARDEQVENSDFICLSVTDDGAGMTVDVLERALDPFFTTKQKKAASGLGLAVVYGLVKQSGGVLDIVSSPERGAMVSLYFPLSVEKPDRVILGGSGDPAGLCFMGYTALVVGDDPEVVMQVGGMLEQMGMRVIRAMGEDEALQVQDDFNALLDVLVVDAAFSGAEGGDLVRLVRTVRPETKIIFMGSELPGGGCAFEVPEWGRFMAKPVVFEALAGLIYRCVSEGKYAAVMEEFQEVKNWQKPDNVADQR